MKSKKEFSKLEQTILLNKGLDSDQLSRLAEAGVSSKEHFEIVGDAQTLADIVDLDIEIAQKVMNWAIGIVPTAPFVSDAQPAGENTDTKARPIIVESADIVNCIHCNARQPKDYKSGDLCLSCGNQAEPVLTCHWCYASGPGKFCRSCGAEFVSSAELDLAVLMKREGEAKNSIARQLKEMSSVEKEKLWARVRRAREQ